MLRIILLGSILGTAPGETPAQDPAPAGPEYKVVYWFDRDRVAQTFQARAYDLRKGEYNREVDAWIEKTRAAYPDYAAYAKEIDLKAQAGASEAEKLANAVEAERKSKTSRVSPPVATMRPRSSLDLGTRLQSSFGLGRGATRPPQYGGRIGSLGPSPGAGGYGPNPPRSTPPFPYPYPRPHP